MQVKVLTTCVGCFTYQYIVSYCVTSYLSLAFVLISNCVRVSARVCLCTCTYSHTAGLKKELYVYCFRCKSNNNNNNNHNNSNNNNIVIVFIYVYKQLNKCHQLMNA